ncbi:Solute carrier family 22 member 6-A [Portunus trituberculatus]|uniref:Solute carrier family 22 member 6-A n=1 Tax=Portunus trituberculatus TaxID=210409 RepID=A0A5B7IXW5_PORTR|nr:Solute carrier family 22 member 6-A [Portunus trituberculatus]
MALKRYEKIDKQDLVVVADEAGRTRGYAKKIRKRQCVKDIGKYSFPHRMVEKWNAFSDEVLTAHNWELVCRNKYRMSLIQSTYMAGVLAGAVVLSELADK